MQTNKCTKTFTVMSIVLHIGLKNVYKYSGKN